ncbi:MAG: acetylxylan esterase [Bryobacteraceae bacterium]
MKLFALVLALTAFAAAAEDAPSLPNTNSHFTMPVAATRAEWEKRAAELRKQILFAAGLYPMPEKPPLNPQLFGKLERQGYTIEKVLIQSLNGYFLGGNLYRPAGKPGKFPAIVSPHGHWTYGRLEHQPLASVPARAINLARQGHVVFTYDMVGYNDTIQTPHDFGSPKEQLWGWGPLGLQLWNSIRAVDFVASLPDVDADRIGATGASGGGTQTFLLAAIDPRVKFAAPVNMISAIMQGGSPCENAPGLRVDTFNVELAALIAPRPLLMVSATGDWTKNTMQEEYPAIKSIYRLYDRDPYLEAVQIDAPHNYNKDSREAVYRFFGKHMLRTSDFESLKEKPFNVEKLNDMLALHNRQLSGGALSYDHLVEQWMNAARRQREAPVDAIRERLLLALKVTYQKSGVSMGDFPGIGVSLAGNEVRVTDSTDTGLTSLPKDSRFYSTFNRLEGSNRVQLILHAISYLSERNPNPVSLDCEGKAAVWCTFAAAVAPVKTTMTRSAPNFAGSDDDFLRNFFIPGIQRAGGWPAAVRLATGR